MESEKLLEAINYANGLEAIKNIRSLPLDVCNIIFGYSAASIFVQDNYFILASKYGYLKLVKYFVEHCGIDTSAVGNKAIHYASGRGYLEIVKYLHSRGSCLTATIKTQNSQIYL
jgi:hypothetical protein